MLHLLERRSEDLITAEEDRELLAYIEADRIATLLKARAELAARRGEA